MSLVTINLNLGVELTMLDVGQGDSVVIRNNNGNVYISDCGSSSVSKIGKYRLIPFLKYKGYGKIKGIFISHLDEDHINGILELLEMAPEERIEISYLFLPESVLGIEEDKELVEKLERLAKENKTKLIFLKQGDRIKDDFMEFLCLYPDSDEKQNGLKKNRNNQSLVLFMIYKDFEMLFTGDIEKEGEKEIVEYIERMRIQNEQKVPDERDEVDYYGKQNGYSEEKKKQNEIWNNYSEEEKKQNETWNHKRIMQCDVLKVAHHGSSGSSSEIFLETINPKLSLISCGKNNSYGHPHEETLERLELVGSKIMSTADSGAITLELKRRKIKIGRYRH